MQYSPQKGLKFVHDFYRVGINTFQAGSEKVISSILLSTGEFSASVIQVTCLFLKA